MIYLSTFPLAFLANGLNFLPSFFFFNNLVLIFLIFNQNETTKEPLSSSHPLEKITWGSFFLQMIFFFLSIKFPEIFS
jgi:hypothetical protein